MNSSQVVSLSQSPRFVSLALAVASLAAFGGTALADSTSGGASESQPAAAVASDARTDLGVPASPAKPVQLAPAHKPQTTLVLATDDQAFADAANLAFGWVSLGYPTDLADSTPSIAATANTAFGWVDTSVTVNNRYVHPIDDTAAFAASANAAFGWVNGN